MENIYLNVDDLIMSKTKIEDTQNKNNEGMQLHIL